VRWRPGRKFWQKPKLESCKRAGQASRTSQQTTTRCPNGCTIHRRYFDGYGPPIYPRVADFDAKRLVDVVLELGGNLLRFQPIGYWAYYPSKAFRVNPDLGGRDLIHEVSQECQKQGIHCYCYTGYGHPHMEVGWVDQHPEFAEWVLRDPEGKPYGTFNHYGWADRQKVCTTGDAYRAGMRQIVKELCEHDIDGVYFDSPSAFGYTGVCFCDSAGVISRNSAAWNWIIYAEC